ncbi:MAG: N-acetylmuramidase domain-containing protein, partial [Candidatus Woesearchaeota archaeon]
RPLIYNVYEEKTIENKIDKGYEIFFFYNELNFKIGLFYKELAYVQSKINEKNRNNKVIPNDLINRRNFLVDELKKLGLSETQIYDRGDLNLDYDLFWELKSSNYLDLYIYNMNFKIASIFQKLSLIQSIINRNETYNVKSEIRNFFYKQLDDLNINYFNKGEHKDLNYDQIWKLRSKEFYSQGFVIDDFQEEISDEIIYYDEFSLEPVSIDEKDYSDLIIEPKQELIWPINLEDNDLILTSCYGWRRLNPINNPNQITWHDGIDIRGNLIDVLAVADGIVYERCEGWPDSCGGRGNYITLYHYDLGTYSQYNHLHELFVEENQKINQGHVIGLMGQTGNVDGPHLDFKYYFDLPMSSRVFNPEGNPLCYLPVLPKENLDIIFKNHIEQKFDEYFADSAESCFWGRIKNKYLGGDNLAGITKCEFYNSIDYQIPFDYNKDKIIASEEPSETEDIFDDGGDIDQVVYNFAFENDIVPAKLFAILNVESSSQPFYSDGHPIVRFECRRYNSRVSGEEMVPCETTYNQPYGIGAHTNYEAFKHALTLNRNQALLQTSFGLGQVMGFNYNLVGYSSVEEFYSSMFNENNQALAFLDFIKSNNQIFNELKNENTNWDIIAHFYAGPGYAQINHHVKLENAYNELLLT